MSQIPSAQYISSKILGHFINVPTYFYVTKFLFKQQSRYNTPYFCFITSQVSIFFNWLRHHTPCWRLCVFHNVGCYSLILQGLWSPPSAEGRWAEQKSKAHSLILYTPADSFEWLSAPGSTHMFRDQSRDQRHYRKSLIMQDPMSRTSSLRS